MNKAEIVSVMDNAVYRTHFQIIASMLQFDFEEFFTGILEKYK